MRPSRPPTPCTAVRKPPCVTLYITLMHFGGIIVPPGYTDPVKFVDGNPYGVSLVSTHDNINEFDDATVNALDHLARRVVSVAERLAS